MLNIEIKKQNARVMIEARNSAEVIADIGMAMRSIYRALKEERPELADEVKNTLDALGVAVFMEDKPAKALAKKCLEVLMGKLADDDDSDDEDEEE